MMFPMRFRMLLAIALLTLGAGWNYDIPASIGAGPGATLQTKFDSLAGVNSSSDPRARYTHATNQGLYAVYSFPNAFLSIAAGAAIDSRLGLHRATLLFGVVGLVGTSLFVLAARETNIGLLFFARLLVGTGNEATVVAMAAWISRWFKQPGATSAVTGLAAAFGLSQAVQRAGGSLNFLLSPRLANAYGVDDALLGGVAATVVSLVAAVAVIVMDGRWYEAEFGSSAAAATAAATAATVNGTPAPPSRQPAAPSLAAATRSSCPQALPIKFWCLMVVAVSIYCVVLPFVGIAPLFFQSALSMSHVDASSTMAAYQLVTAVGQPLVGAVVDRVGRSSVILLGSAVAVAAAMGLAMGAPRLRADGGAAALVAVVLSLGFVCCATTARPAVPLVVPPQRVGLAFGVMAALIALSSASMRLVVGAILDTHTSRAAGSADNTTSTNNNNNSNGTTTNHLPPPSAFLELNHIFLALTCASVLFAAALIAVDVSVACNAGDSARRSVLTNSVAGRKLAQAAATAATAESAESQRIRSTASGAPLIVSFSGATFGNDDYGTTGYAPVGDEEDDAPPYQSIESYQSITSQT